MIHRENPKADQRETGLPAITCAHVCDLGVWEPKSHEKGQMMVFLQFSQFQCLADGFPIFSSTSHKIMWKDMLLTQSTSTFVDSRIIMLTARHRKRSSSRWTDAALWRSFRNYHCTTSPLWWCCGTSAWRSNTSCTLAWWFLTVHPQISASPSSL